MSLDRGSERPEIHAIGSYAHWPTPAACAKGQNLIEAVEQTRPLLGLDRAIPAAADTRRMMVRSTMAEVFERLFLDLDIRIDVLKAISSLV